MVFTGRIPVPTDITAVRTEDRVLRRTEYYEFRGSASDTGGIKRSVNIPLNLQERCLAKKTDKALQLCSAWQLCSACTLPGNERLLFLFPVFC